MITYFTSESVCKGHPDKICDTIADAILDESLRINPKAHNAVEVTIKGCTIFIYGETDTFVDFESIARETMKDIGYFKDFEIIVRMSDQSKEIHDAVENDEDLGAGDQGIVFGYACKETEELMPLSINLAHKIAKNLDTVRSDYLLPDGKTQVTVVYEDGILKSIDTILVSKQHTPSVSRNDLTIIINNAIFDAVDALGVRGYLTNDTKFIINPSGSFVVGGPDGDSGTTGRKIVVDTYGGHGRVGGGCFSSKDPTKVDRSAAYYARYVAKNIVNSDYAKKCEIQVSYGIGIAKPISLHIECFDTNKIPMEDIYKFVEENFDFRPANIIEELDLRRPIYKSTACYGHFGNPEYPWEKIKKF